jgi:hypothetical protein
MTPTYPPPHGRPSHKYVTKILPHLSQDHISSETKALAAFGYTEGNEEIPAWLASDQAIEQKPPRE